MHTTNNKNNQSEPKKDAREKLNASRLRAILPSKEPNKKRYSASREIKRAYRDLKQQHADGKARASGDHLDGIKAGFKFTGHVIHATARTLWRMLVIIVVIALACVIAGALGLGYLYFTSASELPNLTDYTLVSMPQDSTIYDADGEVIGIVSSVQREPVGFGDISQPMKDAIIAIEDERFYNHSGVDIRGVLRALYANFTSWKNGGDTTSQGASTLTQQYIRNAYSEVGRDQTMSRKLTEIMLAAQLESQMSKDDILNSYLNTVYFGNGCYGVEAASRHYFGHPASELDYYESAILSSIVKGPTIYDPETEEGLENVRDRVNLVLDKMYSLGMLGDMSQDDLRQLKQTQIESVLHITEEQRVINQPFYYDYVLNELQSDGYEQSDIESGGWQIYTTLSMKDGEAATEIIKDIEKRYAGTGITGALVDIDNDSGAIHSFCGGTDYDVSKYNIATSGHLQTGSTLKPIVYAGLCEYKGWYMSDTISAEEVNIGTDSNPHWISPYVSGPTATLHQGIVASDNAVTIHVAQEEGMENVQRMCKAVGIQTPIEDNVVACIGGQTYGLTPLELASGYSTIARLGSSKPYWCINKITDSLGNQVYQHEDSSSYAMSDDIALQVISAMKDAVDNAGWYHIPFDKKGWTIAAKTGTTNDDMDSWCVGFDHDRSVALWVGGKDSKVTVPNSSYNTTTSFSDYFDKVGQNDSKDDWPEPQYKTLIPQPDSQSIDSYAQTLKDRQLNVKYEYVEKVAESDGQSGERDDDRNYVVTNAGEYVDRGGNAVIRIARDMVSVPSFISLTPAEAYDKANGLDVDWDVEYSPSGPSSPVVESQSLEQGSLVARGSSITLKITILSQGDSGEETTIQQVPALGTDSALGSLKSERDSLKSENDKLKQQLSQANEAGDSSSETGSKIPNVIGLTAGEARRVLSSVGLSVSYNGSENDVISSMAPSYGSTVTSDTVVSLSSSSSSNQSTTDQEIRSRAEQRNSNRNR